MKAELKEFGDTFSVELSAECVTEAAHLIRLCQGATKRVSWYGSAGSCTGVSAHITFGKRLAGNPGLVEPK